MNFHYSDVIRYHEETKHAPYGYARSSGYMDWANQPVPFRQYDGAPQLKLPLIEIDKNIRYSQLFKRDENDISDFSFKNVAAFLELSMGLSAWKSYEDTSWALRINPSSGNLHPTESHLILPPMIETNNQPGVFHYNPYQHALELRANFSLEVWNKITDHFQTNGFLIGLSSIFWRESWKYGERAFRYCNHDIGHAMACLSFSANISGWKIIFLNTLADKELETLFGFLKTEWFEFEKEHADNLFFVYPSTVTNIARSLPIDISSDFAHVDFNGQPNRLSKGHDNWDIIDQTASWTHKPKTDEAVFHYGNRDFVDSDDYSKDGIAIIRERRSAQEYDRETGITSDQFFCMLDKTIACDNSAPFDLELGKSSIHLLLFVHRISGLEKGIYFLIRNEDDFEDIKSKCYPEFLWKRAKGAPDNLPLYLLKECNMEFEAQSISCQQEIAGEGAFSLGMIARFNENVKKASFLYKHLFWETGMIGQILYLEAEVISMRGTGIGCFFDDLVHQLLGLDDNSYQSLYHFTVGKPVIDKRLTTLPPYHHLDKQ